MKLSEANKRVIRSTLDTLAAVLVVLGLAIPLLGLDADKAASYAGVIVAANLVLAKIRVALADAGIIGQPTVADPPHDSGNQDDEGIVPPDLDDDPAAATLPGI